MKKKVTNQEVYCLRFKRLKIFLTKKKKPIEDFFDNIMKIR